MSLEVFRRREISGTWSEGGVYSRRCILKQAWGKHHDLYGFVGFMDKYKGFCIRVLCDNGANANAKNWNEVRGMLNGVVD